MNAGHPFESVGENSFYSASLQKNLSYLDYIMKDNIFLSPFHCICLLIPIILYNKSLIC